MESKTRMRVNENGRVVIPASFRKRLGIRVGDEVVLQIQDDELRITTLKRNLERAQRLVRKHVQAGTSLVDELIAELRDSWDAFAIQRDGTKPDLWKNTEVLWRHLFGKEIDVRKVILRHNQTTTRFFIQSMNDARPLLPANTRKIFAMRQQSVN